MSEGVRGPEWEVCWPLPVGLWCRHPHPPHHTAVSFSLTHSSYCRKLGLFIVHTLLKIVFHNENIILWNKSTMKLLKISMVFNEYWWYTVHHLQQKSEHCKNVCYMNRNFGILLQVPPLLSRPLGNWCHFILLSQRCMVDYLDHCTITSWFSLICNAACNKVVKWLNHVFWHLSEAAMPGIQQILDT